MSYPNTFPAPFVTNPTLTAITIAYKNSKLIADDVMPRVPVDVPTFNYSVFNKADSFTIPDTKVGRKSAVNEVDYSVTQTAAFVEDHALDQVVPERDKAIAQAYNSPIDPQSIAAEQVSDLLALDREARVSNIIFNANSYASANKTTLSGTSQWSDFTNSDPVSAILNAMDTMMIRPNQMIIGRPTFTKLSTHPKVVQAWHGNNGAYGVAPADFIASLLGLDEVLIGEDWYNAAKKGQTVNPTRVWGKHAALLYKAPVSVSTQSMSFGVTAQWGGRIAATYFDEKRGMRGSSVVRVGESVKEIVLANDLGYFFQNAIA